VSEEEEFEGLSTWVLIKCMYPREIPDEQYKTLLHILARSMSIRAVSSVIAYIKGGDYPLYMGEASIAMIYEPDPEIEAEVIQKLLHCGYETWLKE
jgi:hypothetical protein